MPPRMTTHNWGTSTLLSVDEVTTTQTIRQLPSRQTTARQSTRIKLVTTRSRSSVPTHHKEDANQAWLIVFVAGGVLLGIIILGVGLLAVRFCRRRIRYSGLVRDYHWAVLLVVVVVCDRVSLKSCNFVRTMWSTSWYDASIVAGLLTTCTLPAGRLVSIHTSCSVCTLS